MHTVGHIIDHQSEVDYSHLFVLRAYHEVVWFDISVQVIFTVKVPQTLKGLLCYLFQRNPPLLIFIFKVILERTKSCCSYYYEDSLHSTLVRMLT